VFESRQIHQGAIVQPGGRNVRNVEIGVQFPVVPLAGQCQFDSGLIVTNQDASAYGMEMISRLMAGHLALGDVVQREDNRLAVCESEFDSRHLHVTAQLGKTSVRRGQAYMAREHRTIGRSFNGRTADSKSAHGGSIPSRPAAEPFGIGKPSRLENEQVLETGFGSSTLPGSSVESKQAVEPGQLGKLRVPSGMRIVTSALLPLRKVNRLWSRARFESGACPRAWRS
jgi:hypothetical protein